MVRTYIQRITRILLVAAFGILIFYSSIRGTFDSNQFCKELQALPQDRAYIVFLSQETGSYSFVGKDAEWAAQYAVEQVNASGGVNGRPVELIIRNTESSPQKASVYYRGAAQAALTVIGPADAPEASMIAALQKSGPALSVYSGFSNTAIAENRPYALSYMSNTAKGELLSVQYWSEANPDIRRVVIFNSSDDAAKNETSVRLQQLLPELGLELCSVVDLAADNTGEKNYTKSVINALNQKPDGFISIVNTADYAPLLTELRKRGVEEGRRITASFSSFSPDTIEKAGDALDGTYIWNTFNINYEGEEWKLLADAYRAEHEQNEPITPVIHSIYDTVLAVCRCYEELDLNGIGPEDSHELARQQKAVAEWLYNSPEIQGIQGPIHWKSGLVQSEPSYFVFDGNVPVLQN